jgi:hypothetical protein
MTVVPSFDTLNNDVPAEVDEEMLKGLTPAAL